MRGQPGTDPIGKARAGIRLVDHERHSASPGSEVGREGGVPAKANDDLSPEPIEQSLGLAGSAPRTRDHAREVAR
jgi:hypothetical protein